MKILSYYLATAAMAVSIVFGASAVPATPYPIDHVQPDGSIISVRLEGDEFGHLAFDASGQLLERDARGFYVPSDADPDRLLTAIEQRRTKAVDRRNAKGAAMRRLGLVSHTNFTPMGSNPTLVILVEFQDRKFLTDNPQDFYDRMLNGDDFTDYGATGSARRYFSDNSRGQFTPRFDVLGPVTLPENMAYYGANIPVQSSGMVTLFDDARPYQMVLDACAILKAEGLDFAQYDTNDDGEVDNIYVFYAGYGEADGGPADTIWPHAWYLDGIKGVDPVYYDGVLLSHYACSNELQYPAKLGQPVEPDGIGTIIHEFSHVMGFPDLYTTLGNDCNTPRYWSVMDVGCYLNKKRTPPNYSGVELMSFGWITPEELTAGSHELPYLHGEEGKAYIVRRTEPRPDGTSPEEFFIFENRQKSGWDMKLPSHGMLVWHVDFDQEAWDTNMVNTLPKHQRVRVVEADNQPARHEVVEEPGKMPEYKEVLYNEGDPFPGTTANTSFTPTSVPAFVDWNGNSMQLYVTDIAESADGLITFAVTSSGENGLCRPAVDNAEGERYFDLQGLPVTHPREGQLLIRLSGTTASKIRY